MPPQYSVPRWSTSTFDEAGQSAPMDLQRLGEHYSLCNVARSRWFSVRCSVEAVHDFIAPRFVTTLLIVSAVIALATAF